MLVCSLRRWNVWHNATHRVASKRTKAEIMDYGTRIAMNRAKANARRKRTEALKTITTADRAPTEYSLYPMQTYEHTPTGHIDWDATATDSASAHLVEQIVGQHRSMQLLQQPAGTGKTAVAVKTLAMLHQSNPEQAFVILASRAIIESGGWQSTIAEWNAEHPDSPLNPALIDTYDRFTNIITNKQTRDELLAALGDNPVIVIDEVHNYKNPTSKRAKALQKIKDKTVLGLSATPITNNVALDMCSYLVMAGFYRNKTEYLTKTELNDRLDQDFDFFIYDKRGHIDALLWPKYPLVLGQMSTVLFQPDVSVTVDQLPQVSSPMQRLDMSDDLAADLRSLDRAYAKRMFDSAADYVLSIQERINTDPHRVKWLMETITASEVEQPLVFYWHTAVRDAITQTFDAAGVDYQLIAGDTDTSEVDKTDVTRPILIQYQAGGEGIEFPRSNTSVFFENQGSYARLVQARGRNVRLGMSHAVTHHYCVSDAPFDSEVLDRVLRREEVSEKVMFDIAQGVAIKSSGKRTRGR